MPIEETSCNECGHDETRCPECGLKHVTPRDNHPAPSPTDIVDYGLANCVGPKTASMLDCDREAEEITYTHICWNCGWSEDITLSVERTTNE